MACSIKSRTCGILIAGLLYASSLPGTVRAEVFHLVTGGTIEGKLLNTLSDPSPRYVIKTSTGRIVLETNKVVRIERKPDVLLQYEAARPKVPNTVEGHMKMARLCSQLKLMPQREYHLEQVVKLDPDHVQARQLLGYIRKGDGWHKVDLWMKQQGYVRVSGRWRIPQEVENDNLREQRSKEEINWRVKIRQWETAIVKGRSTQVEAMRNLKAIEAYRATPALADRVNDMRQPPPRELRLLYIDILISIGGSVATGTMMTRVMEDEDGLVRERCLEQLRRWKSRRAMLYFIGKLSSKDNRMVNRAGWALGSLGNPEAVLPLINALVTTHQQMVGGGGGINAGFGSDGGVGFGAGGKPKIIQRDFMNQDVLSALSQLVPPGFNYSYNEEAWHHWYTRSNTPTAVNLRRDR
jgi:hypothetical protein